MRKCSSLRGLWLMVPGLVLAFLPSVQGAPPAAQDRRPSEAEAPKRSERNPEDLRLRRAPGEGRKARKGAPRGPGPKMIERLMQMPPDERQRFLRENERFRRLPAQQQQRIQRRLQQFGDLPPEQRQLLLERYRLFRNLPPEKQSKARGIYRRWRELPGPRRQELVREVEQLRRASPERRRERLASEEFLSSYDEQERQILEDLSGLVSRSREN